MEINTAKRLDNALFLVLKISGGLIAVLVTLSFFMELSAVWMATTIAVSLLTCTVLIVLKGALTGKRYAQGAKNRRARFLPMLFSNNESLEDDMMSVWRKK